jgi:catalase
LTSAKCRGFTFNYLNYFLDSLGENKMNKPIRLAAVVLAVWGTAAWGQDLEGFRAAYPQADPFLGEKLGATEIEDAFNLANDLSNTIRRDYVNGSARRDAHPKAHGCVRASFSVRDDLPAEFTAGVFQPGARYDALIRFSNGSPNAAGDDRNGDTRGMAMKLFGVDGEKLFPDPAHPDAQDIIQISSPYFFVNGSSGYTEFFRIVNKGDLLPIFKIPFILGWQGTINAAKMLSQKIPSPLDAEYFSVTAYQLGEGDSRTAVKYNTKPCAPATQTYPVDGPNYLRHAMQAQLSTTEACFDFSIQKRPDDSFSTEDTITVWDDAKAPSVAVAKITIPVQQFDTAAQNAACEQTSFNPWHSISAHRPLGTVNRMRRMVYETISELRKSMNGGVTQ